MEYIKYLKECGFNDEEIETKLKEREIMKELYFNGEKKEPRYITSATYERARRITTKSVDGWLTGRR